MSIVVHHKCDICHTLYDTAEQLEAHMNGGFHCDTCKHAFFDRESGSMYYCEAYGHEENLNKCAKYRRY